MLHDGVNYFARLHEHKKICYDDLCFTLTNKKRVNMQASLLIAKLGTSWRWRQANVIELNFVYQLFMRCQHVLLRIISQGMYQFS